MKGLWKEREGQERETEGGGERKKEGERMRELRRMCE